MVRRLLVVASVLALFLLPAGAGAHAVLVASSPAADALVETAPQQVTLTFNEDVSPVGSRLQVIGPDGARYETGAPAVAGRTVTGTVAPDLPEGTSTIAWTIISDDGHRISGAFTFSVGQVSGAGDAAAATAALERPAGADTAQSASRALRFVGILLLVGLLAVVALVWNPTVRRGRTEDPAVADVADAAFRPLARRLALLTPPLLALVALATLPLETWADELTLREVLDLRQGQVAVAQALLALAVWPLLVRGVTGSRRGVLIAATVPVLLLALTPGLGGHASAQDPAWLAISLDWLHVLAAGVWGGGVLVLAITAPAVHRATAATTRGPLVRGVVRRFSRLALVGLVALIFGGALSALLLTDSVTDLWETTWGRVLIAKVAVVLLALVIAGLGRRAGASLGRSLQVEAVLIVAVIALTGTLTGLAPQPPAAAAPTTPYVSTSGFHLEQRIDAREAQVDITPATTGQPNEVHVIVTNGVGQPALDVKDASVVLSSDTVERLPVALTVINAAHWTGTVQLPTPGSWQVVVRLRIGEFREELLEGTMTVS
jgi:copper transport protein